MYHEFMRKNIQFLMFNLKSQKGFTLVELLVVIVIISILATLLMANFVGVRQRGRDTTRKSDLRQIQSALEIYRADNGNYPLTANFPACGVSFPPPPATTIYMKKVPCDPLTKGNYNYSSDGISGTYTLIACLENAADADKDGTSAVSCGTSPSLTFTQP